MRVAILVLLACVGLAAAALTPPPQFQGLATAKGGEGLKIKCASLFAALPKGPEADIKALVNGNFEPTYEVDAIRLSVALAANGVNFPAIPKSPADVGSVTLKSGKVAYPTMEQLTAFLKKTYHRPSWEAFGKLTAAKLAGLQGIIRYKAANNAAAPAAPAAAAAAAPAPAPGKAAAGDNSCEVCMFALASTEYGAKPDANVCGKAKAGLGDKAEASCKDMLDQMQKKADFFTQMKNNGCELRGALVKPCPEPQTCSKLKTAAGAAFCPGAAEKNALDLFDGKVALIGGAKIEDAIKGSRKIGIWTCDA